MNKLNKIISVFLIVILLVGIIPIENIVFGSTEAIIYQTPKLEVGVINKKAVEIGAFMRNYVFKENPNFNLVNKFSLYSSKNIKGKAPNVLSYNSYFKHKENGSGWYANYKWDYSVYPNLTSLIDLNQLKINITGSLALDEHKNFGRHWGSIKDKAVLNLSQLSFDTQFERWITGYSNSNKDPDQSPVVYGYDLGKDDLANFLSVGINDYTQFLLKLKNSGCACGSSTASKLSFCMLDATNPYIQKIYTTKDINDSEDNIKSGFINNETGYINIKFNEPIRFSNDKSPEFGKYTLMFNLLNTENNQEVSGHGMGANLVALKNDTLIFKFITPATIGSDNTNHYISDILNLQNWVKPIGDKSFDLVTLGDGGKIVDMGSDTDLIKTSSLITDLAGNPINWGACTKDVNPDAYLDNVIPYINSVEINGTEITIESVTKPINKSKYSIFSTNYEWPEDIDRSAVFAGIGDSITFYINLNEEINLGSNDISTIKATLNANKSGSPIILNAKRIDKVKNGANGIDISRITFESLTITEDMINVGEVSQLAITNLSVPSDVKDLRGNVVSNNIELTIKPKQQQWLDTLFPSISTAISADSENKYTPIFYDSSNKKEFYFPINISDNDSRGIEYTSGSYGASGMFSWFDNDSKTNYPFEYYVSATTAKPSNYNGGTVSTNESGEIYYNLTQVEGGNYIHIKLLDGIKYNFSNSKFIIIGNDYAGNICKNNFKLNYNTDYEAPIYEQAGFSTEFNSTTSQGAITAKIKVSDTGGIYPNDILYQWVDKDDAYITENWKTYPDGGSVKRNEYLISIEKGMLSDNTLHEYDLWIKCTDINNNENIESFSYRYDLTRAASIIDIVTDPTKPIAHPIIAVTNPIGRDLAGTGEITPATTLLMIKNPNLLNKYYIRVVSSNIPEQVTDILSDINYERWYVADVDEDEDSFNFTNGTILTALDETDDLKLQFFELRENYYGELEFTAITGYEIGSPDVLSELSKIDGSISVENFAVKSAAIANGERQIHSISIQEALMADGSDVPIKYTNVPIGEPYGIGYDYDENYIPNGEPRFMSSLDGIQIPFMINNDIISDWGVDDVDFESSETYAALYYTKNGKGKEGSVLEEICKIPLIPNSTLQNLIIPEGATEKTGFYCFEVSVKSMDKYPTNLTQIVKKYNTRIYLNTENIEEDYGFYGSTVEYYYKENEADPEDIDYILEIDKTEPNGIYTNSSSLGTLDSSAVQEFWILKFGRYMHDMYENSLKYNKEYISSDNEEILISDNACFKVWNGADVNGNNNAPWARFDKDIVFVNDASEINDSLYQPNREYGNAQVPIIRGVENTILYQMKLENSLISPIRQLTISTSNLSPSFELEISPKKPLNDSLVSEVLSTMQSVFSVNGLYEAGCVNLPTENNKEPIQPDFINNSAIIKENGKYLFYAVDNLGNISTSLKMIDYIDSIAPTVRVSDNGSNDNEFNLLVEITDNYELNGGEIYLSFDIDYSNLLNREEDGTLDDNNIVLTTVPHNSQGGEWHATSASKDGIYYTNTTLQSVDGKYNKQVEIRGAFKFDNNKSEGAVIERLIKVTASDKAGVISPMYDEIEEYNETTGETTYTIIQDPDKIVKLSNTKNIAPKFLNSNLTSEDKINLNFTAPVLNDKPRDTIINPHYTSKIESLPIYSDGQYSISYLDMFGKRYEENISIAAYEDFDIKVNISQEEPTNSDVIVSLDAVNKEGLTIEAINGTSSEDIRISTDKKTSTVLMKQNGTLVITLKNKGITKTRSIMISNIDKEPPVVKAYLYYTNGEPLVGETTTDGDVIAGVICGETLIGLNGSLSYTFTFGGPTSHTFEFSDLAGNKGALTVILPHIIVDSGIADTTEPSYEMDIYVKANNTMNQYDTYLSWGSETVENLINNLPSAQGYLLNIIPQDQSHVKLIVKTGTPTAPPNYNDVSDNIEGLIIGERSIVIDRNVDCTAFLVDSSGNSISIPLKIIKLDNKAPEAKIIYIPTSFYSIRAYLKEIGVSLDPNGFIITNLSGVNLEDSTGEYKGLYYHDFNENESYIFYYKDGVGNADTKDAIVTTLDTTSARVENVMWSPINPTITKNLINKDITARVGFNKTVKEIVVDWVNDIDKTKNIDDYISVDLFNDSAIISYKQNTPMIRLKLISLNNKESMSNLPEVNCIDKLVPNITINTVELSKDKKSAGFSIISDKEVSFAEGINPGVFGTSFTKNVTENGAYVYNFTDKAGNSVSKTVIVSEIDNEKLALSFNMTASDIGATTKANELNVKIGDTFYIKMNKSGVVLLNDKSVNITANIWLPFVIEQSTKNSLYVIKATDERGDTFYAYLNIVHTDRVPPTIILKNGTISIIENADSKILENTLVENVILSDDVTLRENISFSCDISSVNLNSKGVYSVNYKAIDEAGNLRELSGYICVYGKDELDIRINGTKAYYNSTIVVNTKNIAFDVKNINGEPYKIYYKSGIKTEGQMKIGATLLADKSISLSENGYYTVYIITQSRRSFITYVYVEQ